ncbi:MAG TPA: type IX secretion system plug protein domain-containing protein, partial [Patescibacteria group bacterium]|nr:type IX secretion system plug protein domain-containing protein [Patescibacteria group bacterium]
MIIWSLLAFLSVFGSGILHAQTADDFSIPPQVRFMRAYGGSNETQPPIVIMPLKTNSSFNPPIGERQVTIEMDVQASIPPSLYVKFVHCTIDWKEDDNIFLNDATILRTSNIEWQTAPAGARFYSFRGRVRVPDEQVKFPYAGNWKAKFYNYDNEHEAFAEARFFVVNPVAYAEVNVWSSFYEPKLQVSPSALIIETQVAADNNIYDSRLRTVTLYRNHRWQEPLLISQDPKMRSLKNVYGLDFPTSVGGFLNVAKRFRIENIPAQNDYRVLDLSNTAQYPRISAAQRLPLNDLPRSGSSMFRADDGAMLTYAIAPTDDDYVVMEFTLETDGRVPTEEVFVTGSFNNWTPTREWQMYYDEKDRLLKLRAPMRRGRHNYLYATGKLNVETNRVEELSFERYEGNNSSAPLSFISLVYYRET